MYQRLIDFCTVGALSAELDLFGDLCGEGAGEEGATWREGETAVWKEAGPGFRVQGLGFKVQGLGYRVQGLGFWV